MVKPVTFQIKDIESHIDHTEKNPTCKYYRIEIFRDIFEEEDYLEKQITHLISALSREDLSLELSIQIFDQPDLETLAGLFHAIKHSPGLCQIDFSAILFQWVPVEDMASCFIDNTNIKYINVNAFNSSTEKVLSFFQNLQRGCPHLEGLGIDNLAITNTAKIEPSGQKEGKQTIAKQWQQWLTYLRTKTDLKYFSLKNIRMDSASCGALKTELCRFRTLSTFSFTECPDLDEATIGVICELPKRNPQLTTLQISRIGFKDHHLEMLVNSLLPNPFGQRTLFGQPTPVGKLNHLDLSHCDIGANDTGFLNNGLKAIGRLLTYYPSLTYLSLNCSNQRSPEAFTFSQESFDYLLKGLVQNKTLQKLDLNQCYLQPASLVQLFNFVQNHQSLQSLILNGNNLSGKLVFNALYDCIKLSEHLQKLSIQGSELSLSQQQNIIDALSENSHAIELTGFSDIECIETAKHVLETHKGIVDDASNRLSC